MQVASPLFSKCSGRLVHKTWADDRTLAGLLRGLDDLLAPQAYLGPGTRGP